MYFVNMTSKENVLMSRDSKDAIPAVMGGEDCCDKVLVKSDKAIGFSDQGTGDALFGKGLTPESGKPGDAYLPKFTKLTYADIKDTQENPILLVFCNEIGIFRDIPAGLKYLYMGSDGILAALIYGSCSFDGVPLQRCDTRDITGMEPCRRFKGTDLAGLVKCEDSESGYNYLWDVVPQVHMVEKASKSGAVSFSCSRIKDFEYNFNEAPLIEARKVHAEKVAAEKAAREAEKERHKLEYEETLRRRAECMDQEALKAASKPARSSRSAKSPKSSNILTGSQGAAAFLAAVGLK